MAHWIIEKRNGSDIYKCSECGARWVAGYPDTKNIDNWHHCLSCGMPLTKDVSETNEYSNNTAIKPEPMKDVVILSIEKYDAMRDEFNICIEERDRELSKLDNELRVITKSRDCCLDILKNMGLTEERAKHIVPGTGKFIEEEVSSVTMNRKIYCCFEIDGSWRE